MRTKLKKTKRVKFKRRYKMTTQNNQLRKAIKARKRKLDQQIESAGWALFLIWSGALLVAPDGLVPGGSWLIGTGLIIIASMGIRYLYGIRVEGFWTVLGFLALSFGISEYFRLDLPVFPVIFIIIGVVIVYYVFLGKSDHNVGFWKYRNHVDFRKWCYNSDFWKYCWKDENDDKA
jgi:hypothetical protein